MSTRTFVVLGLVVAAAFVGWRLVLPTASDTDAAVRGVTALLDTTTRAQFIGAQATLETQRRMTGSYAGAAVPPPLRLVRADASSYCLELVRGSQPASLTGPGGTAHAGTC